MDKTVNLVGADWWYEERDENNNVRYRPPEPTSFKVTYNKREGSDITLFVNEGVLRVDDFSSKKKFALPNEQRDFAQGVYTYLYNNNDKFDGVLTYDDDLRTLDNAIIAPYGNTFIWPTQKQQIYPKEKSCSYIASNKAYTNLQKFRVELLQHFYDHQEKYDLDLFGRGHNPLPELEERGKLYGLVPYRFSIAIENLQTDHYFSEKLLDCFLTGTIPIYYGARKVSEYFDPNGMIVFNDLTSLEYILESLSEDLYNSKLEAISYNFNKALEYTDPLKLYLNLVDKCN
jgi:hypothetical protein